jgi:tetratricopeptide (TPR) repeat protein/transcriptional regulator with XRE-family HTH domain
MSERTPAEKNVDIRGTEFPRILRALRESRNLTKAELADKVDLSAKLLGWIEAGKRERVLDKTLCVLQEFFGVTRDQLLGRAPLPPLNGNHFDPSPSAVTPPPDPARRFPDWARILAGLATLAVLAGAFFGVRNLAVSKATWKVTGNCITVRDGLFGLKLWEDCHKSPIAKEPSSVKFVRWGHDRVIAYGLEPGPDDGGTLFVRTIATGKILLQDRPDPLELAAVYPEELIRNGGFHCQEIHDADLDGDGGHELVAYFKHSPWYPAYLRMYIRNREDRVYGTYFFNGHLSDILVQDIDEDGKDEILTAGTNNAREYMGAMVVLLDGEHCRGASADANALPLSQLPDSARARVIFPMFDSAFARHLNEQRLRAQELQAYRTAAGDVRIKANVGVKDSTIVVTMNGDLVPLAADLIDNFHTMMRRWPEEDRKKFLGGYVDEWLANAHRFTARSLSALAEENGRGTSGRRVKAHRHYSEGTEYLKRLMRDQAVASFKQAVECDSTYARAWLMLLHPSIAPQGDKWKALDRKVSAYADELTETDRLFWQALRAYYEGDIPASISFFEKVVERDPYHAEAYRRLAAHYESQRNYPKAISSLEAAIAADATDGVSLNRIAYLYAEQKSFEKALAAVEKYIELAPSEANPYDSQGDILTRMGKRDAAVAAYKAALARRADFAPSLQSLGCLYVLERNYTAAAECFRRLEQAADPDARGRARFYQACIPLYRGKFKTAVRRLDEGLEADEREKATGDSYLTKLAVKSLVSTEIGEIAAAKKEFGELLDLHEKRAAGTLGEWAIDYVQILARDDLQSAEAFLDSLKMRVDSADTYTECLYHACKGWVELAQGRPQAAVESLLMANEKTHEFYYEYPLALAYLEAGSPAKAIDAFRHALASYSGTQVRWAMWSVKARYHLGRAYEAVGDKDNARRAYEAFLEYWGEPEGAVPEVADARKRAAQNGGSALK